MFHFNAQQPGSPMVTPGRNHGRPGAEQDSPSNTPTNPSRAVAVAQTPATAAAHPTEQQHSAHKAAQAKHAPLPDVHFHHPSAQKDAHGKSIRQGPGLAVAPPAMGNTDQSVSMDISAEYGAQRPERHKSPNSSEESYITPQTAGHQQTPNQLGYGRQLLSPAQVTERRPDVDAPKQVKEDQYQILRTDVQQQAQRNQDVRVQGEVNPTAAAAAASSSSANNASAALAQQNSGVYSLSDEQLADRLHFEREIGHGNWGSIWTVQPRHPDSITPHLPSTTLAAKLCHRQRTAPSNARVRSLWNEFKVLKAVGSAPWPKDRNPRKASLSVGPAGRGRVMVQPPAGHPAIMRFYEFLITPSYAVIIMPYFRQPMNVALPPETCRAYFQHLLSGIFWLHQNNVTHNDVKTANTLVEILPTPPGFPADAPINPVLHSIPILADFGFAQLHDEASVAKNFDKDGNLMPRFCTKNSWGTPEYLSPERARGDLHDERLSDLWSLGVTFFEIATGRTPFENEEEQFLTKEELAIYYERTMSGAWIGSYSISHELEDLIRGMLSPDPLKRVDEADALLHPYFVDSQLIQDAEETDDLSNITDDLDASLGAMVRAQVEAVKAERSRRQAYEGDSVSSARRKEKNIRVLDEPSVDVAAPGSTSNRSAYTHGEDRSTFSGGDNAVANGLVSTDSANKRKSNVIFPSVLDTNVEQVGHHSQTPSTQSRPQEIDSDVSVHEDRLTHKYWKPAPSTIVASTPISASKMPKTPQSPMHKPGTESKTENILSPMFSKYKKSQALISGAFHGTPMGKAKQREAAAKEAAASASRTPAAVTSTPKFERTHNPKVPSRSRLYQYEFDPDSPSNVEDGKRRSPEIDESARAAQLQIKRETQVLGSPISLQRSLDASRDPSQDERPFRSPTRSAWAQSVSGDDSREVIVADTSSASRGGTSSQSKSKEGNRLLAFARTVKRSMSKSSILGDSSSNLGHRSPMTTRSTANKIITPSAQQEPSLLDQAIQQRRQQAVERLERGFDTPKVLNQKVQSVADSPTSWYSTAPAASSAASDGRQNPHLVHRRKPTRATSEVLPKPIRSQTDGDEEDSEQDEEEENISEGRRSPTMVVAAQREKNAAAQRKLEAQASMTRLRPENAARAPDRRRTTSDSDQRSGPSTRTAFDTIAGRLDAMSQHASSLLRLVEETRSSFGAAKPSDHAAGSASHPEMSADSQEALMHASDEQADRSPNQRSAGVHARAAQNVSRRTVKQQRPYSMHDIKNLTTDEKGAHSNLVSEGYTSASQVGEQSEGTTLVGDFSSAAASYQDNEHFRKGSISQWAPKASQRGGQSRLSAISTPLKAKMKNALFDNVSSAHKTPLAHGAAGHGDGNTVPSYATVRKHNTGWQYSDLAGTPETPSVVGNETYHTAYTPGSPESGHWVKVEENDTPVQSPAVNATNPDQPNSSRFSMRRTRSFMLSALSPQSQGLQIGQQSISPVSATAPPPPRKSLHMSRSPRTQDNGEEVESPAAAVANANRQVRGTTSIASSSLAPGSSISSRPAFMPSTVAQVPPAVTAPRTPGKAVSRLLKLIRGGGSSAVDLSSVHAPRAYESASSRAGGGTDTTHAGDEYGYFSQI
ncbi:hypothetical protein CF327_g7083 [Tilletia walkeri]|nr:hypothetical protein CF327_g7083 [Tilletia walkeri]